MRKLRIGILLGLIVLLTMMSFPVEVVCQTYEWSDNFNDGNYDGWTTVSGTYDASSLKLKVTAMGAGDSHPFIYHQSNTSFGNWSFDVTIVEDVAHTDHAIVSFMSDHASLVNPAKISFILHWQGDWTLFKETTEVDSFPALRGWEHHIRVERARADPYTFNIYHNGTLALSAFALVPPADWGYFGFSASIGSSIDNINVEPEPEDTTTTSTDTTNETTSDPSTTPNGSPEPLDTTMILVIAGAGVAVVVIVAIVVKMRS